MEKIHEGLVTSESEKVSENNQKWIRLLYLLVWCFKAHSARPLEIWGFLCRPPVPLGNKVGKAPVK